jgi:L-amino acid N-acyltransferase YncA
METIRVARVEDAPGIGRVHVDSWRTTYKGIVSDEVLANLSYAQREQNAYQRLSNPPHKIYTYVAEDEQGQIVGFIVGGINRDTSSAYKSELYAIYTLQSVQGHGVGKRLTKALVKRLVEDELYSMLVWVLADNPSRGFYEALGGRYVSTKPIEIGGVILNEVSYGWEDIRVML